MISSIPVMNAAYHMRWITLVQNNFNVDIHRSLTKLYEVAIILTCLMC